MYAYLHVDYFTHAKQTYGNGLSQGSDLGPILFDQYMHAHFAKHHYLINSTDIMR